MATTIKSPAGVGFGPFQKQTLQYTPPGGVFDDAGNRVESFGGTGGGLNLNDERRKYDAHLANNAWDVQKNPSYYSFDNWLKERQYSIDHPPVESFGGGGKGTGGGNVAFSQKPGSIDNGRDEFGAYLGGGTGIPGFQGGGQNGFWSGNAGPLDRFGRQGGSYGGYQPGGGFNPSNQPIDVWNMTGGGVNPRQQPQNSPIYEVWDQKGGGSAPPPLNPPYNSNPQPQPGGTPFGERPGPIGMPNPAGDLGTQYPNLPATNASVSNNILAELGGQLSPETENALWDSANRFGVASGMPGAGLWSNKFMGNLAGAIEARKAQGIQHYNQTIPTISGTQTVRPETQINLAETNSINAAAPNPELQSSYSEWLYDKYLNKLNPAGGTVNQQSGEMARSTPNQSPVTFNQQPFSMGVNPVVKKNPFERQMRVGFGTNFY